MGKFGGRRMMLKNNFYRFVALALSRKYGNWNEPTGKVGNLNISGSISTLSALKRRNKQKVAPVGALIWRNFVKIIRQFA